MGIIAALIVFGRALTILGANAPIRSGEDGFALWRTEMGYLMAGLLLFEGSTLIDLTTATGWPGVDSRFLEQTLHWRAGMPDFFLSGAKEASDEDLAAIRRHVML